MSEEVNTSDDSGFHGPQHALTDDGILKVYSVGKTTVLGFEGRDVPSKFNAAHYRTAIRDLLLANESSTVAFDLTGVRFMPSGMLGLLASLSQLDGLTPTVQVFNPGTDVREVLQTTGLSRIIEIHEMDAI